MFSSKTKITLVIGILLLLGILIFGFGKMKRAPLSVPSSLPSFTQDRAPLPDDVSMSSRAPLVPVKHVFIVVEENTDYNDVIDNAADMPYFNDLANTNASAKEYYATTHPSIGNYFMLTTGKNITNQDSFSRTVSEDNVVRQVLAAHKTWKEYSETLPSVGYTGGDADPYEQHHNPLSYFSDVRNDETQKRNLVPIEQLKNDITNHSLPDFAFIVPDNTDNGHDCPHGNSCSKSEKLKAVDMWLRQNIEPLIKSSDFSEGDGGILIVTFDEAGKSDKNGGGGHVPWIVVGPDIKKGYRSDTRYQHDNTLKFISELLGLPHSPGKAEQSASMMEFVIEGKQNNE